MTDLFAARSQMAMSLAFHIVFSIVGMGMPLLMVIAEGWWLRTGDVAARALAHRWAKGTAIMFAVGAVSGTVLSFELGLLWPTFMQFAGPIVGMPFSLEGFAFFFEAIFLGVYFYGWDRVKPVVHWVSGIGVWLSGMISGVFVVSANAWMNTPVGFAVDDATGEVTVDPVAAMFNPAFPSEALHMSMAALVSVGFLVAGIHAWYLLRTPASRFHERGLAVALGVAIVTGLLQPLTGHVAAEHIATHQPVKLAAAEALWETTPRAPLVVGGWPDAQAEHTTLALEIPGALSLLAFGDLDAPVQGLKATPPEDRPPVAVVHAAYQVMLGLGMAMAGTSVLTALLWIRRRRVPTDPWVLRLLVLLAPAGVIAVEAGWTVTEVGRQPWVVQGVMRTADAVTPMPGIAVTFAVYSLLYLVLGTMTVLLLRRQFHHAPDDAALEAEP
ncbi:MAG: cytochrome ubiquinol oxidase subunit I [Alphaproteobacteria bacterium]|nr:cytochrome ubiquinol oxidase subunit I [Alphaproteobacteria bacterium]